jgi:hypothetical protein
MFLTLCPSIQWRLCLWHANRIVGLFLHTTTEPTHFKGLTDNITGRRERKEGLKRWDRGPGEFLLFVLCTDDTSMMLDNHSLETITLPSRRYTCVEHQGLDFKTMAPSSRWQSYPEHGDLYLETMMTPSRWHLCLEHHSLDFKTTLLSSRHYPCLQHNVVAPKTAVGASRWQPRHPHDVTPTLNMVTGAQDNNDILKTTPPPWILWSSFQDNSADLKMAPQLKHDTVVLMAAVRASRQRWRCSQNIIPTSNTKDWPRQHLKNVALASNTTTWGFRQWQPPRHECHGLGFETTALSSRRHHCLEHDAVTLKTAAKALRWWWWQHPQDVTLTSNMATWGSRW